MWVEIHLVVCGLINRSYSLIFKIRQNKTREINLLQLKYTLFQYKSFFLTVYKRERKKARKNVERHFYIIICQLLYVMITIFYSINPILLSTIMHLILIIHCCIYRAPIMEIKMYIIG